MNKSLLLTVFAPRLILAAGLMLSSAGMAAYAASDPAPQQQNQTTRVVKGTVVDKDGEPLIGVSVIIQGSGIGATTDVNGNFRLQSPNANPKLTVSYVGCKTKEVDVNGDAPLNIVLEPSSENLEEIVVTALGIKRETKALGYAIQDIKGESMTEARENNIVNSLSGRIAGLQVSGTGSGSTGSSKILIRGNNSLAGNNQPLIVVDGVPIANSSGGGSEWGGSDGGNSLNDINPDDIESISVLKGAAAAALYGTRAGNGVLMITTKKGSEKKGLNVTFNSNVMIERPLAIGKMQNVYGQGTNGQYVGGNNLSWGPKMEGQMIEDWTGQERPFLPYSNDIMDYLTTGVSTTNTVEAGFTGEKGSFRTTLSYQYIDGVVPTNHNDRFNMNLRGTINITKNLQFDTKVNYIKSKKRNIPSLGASASGIMRNYLLMPRSIHYSDLEKRYDELGNALRWQADPSNLLNPYLAEDNKRFSARDRFIGFLMLSYKVTDWLSVKIRHGEDIYWSNSESRTVAEYPLGSVVGKGSFSLSNSFHRERNTDALITLNKDNWFGSEFSASLSVGGNLMYVNSSSASMSSGELEVPNAFYIANGTAISASNDVSRKQVNSIYGMASLSYGGWVYVDVTARNDWSSTLPSNNCSFFYPSVGIGLIVTDLLHNEFKLAIPSWLTFAKLRASYAEVGNDTSPYSISDDYTVSNIVPGGSLKGSYVSEVSKLHTLMPENIKSTEIGFDFRVFNNRLGIDFTWYKKNATNQILSIPISKATGYSSRKINAGNIENQGVEVVISANPVKTRDFSWTSTINYTLNRNKIKDLHSEIDVYVHSKYEFAQVVSRKGANYGDILGYRFNRDPEGRIIVDENGLPTRTSNMATENPLGNYLPKWTGSMLNSFNYRDFSLSFLLDLRVGGDVYMNSLAQSSANGTSLMSLEGRDAWYAGTGGILVDGVVAQINDAGETVYVPNTTYCNPQEYWSSVKNVGERHVYDGTNLRLRELTLGYSLPKKILAKTPFSSVKLSAVARNLWIIYNNIPGGYDPETILTTGNGGGIEHYSFPTMRSFGFNLNVTF